MPLPEPLDAGCAPPIASKRKTVWSRLVEGVGRALDGTCEGALAGECVTLCSAEVIAAVAELRARRAADRPVGKR